jgi:hypothetical protein
MSPGGGSGQPLIWLIVGSTKGLVPMSSTTFTTQLSIGELEANYALYCQALRILAREGASVEKVKRTVCWRRLATLHHCLPRQYRDPEILYFRLRQDVQGNTPVAR